MNIEEIKEKVGNMLTMRSDLEVQAVTEYIINLLKQQEQEIREEAVREFAKWLSDEFLEVDIMGDIEETAETYLKENK